MQSNWASQVAVVVENPLASVRDVRDLGSMSGSGRSSGGVCGSPRQYSCLENPMAEEPGDLQSMGHKESDMTEAT